MSSVYDEHLWYSSYPDGMPHELPTPDATVLDSFADTVARSPEQPCLIYFDRVLSFSDVDELSTAFAVALRKHDIGYGDRVALYLQNDPDYAIAELGTWKVGGVVVSINPMLRDKELEYLLSDSGATALVCLTDLWTDVASRVVGSTSVTTVIMTDPNAWSEAAPSTALDPIAPPEWIVVEQFQEMLSAWPGESVPIANPRLEDIACICYTSGTSGRPKGVMTTHANMAYNTDVYQRWMSISDQDIFLCGTPIYHITGLIAGLALSYSTGMPLVLFHRFDPGVCLELAERWRATFTVMAITAFQSLMNDPTCQDTDLSALEKIYSGGAPIPLPTKDAWRAMTGSDIHNIYGLTETTSPSHAVPLGSDAPVDDETGTLSVGVPVPGVDMRVVDPQTSDDAPVGELGELWIRGPMVAQGYWNLPDATAETFVDGYLRTGDVGKMDAGGWFYVVDRIKDMINAAGFKVWPREVEDFLLEHPDLGEAAVVGVPDEYRGETVKAFVVPKRGADPTPEAIIAFCREHMAAYKYPRLVEIVDELPKTASGKVLRRELRGHHTVGNGDGT